MSTVPEVVLAREAELCYANIGMVTDYDCWRDSHVSTTSVIDTMKLNAERVTALLKAVIPQISDRNCGCGSALTGAMF